MKEIINLTNDQFVDFSDGGSSFCGIFWELGRKFIRCHGAAKIAVKTAFKRKMENLAEEKKIAVYSFSAGCLYALKHELR